MLFNRLYGEDRKLILCISNLTDKEALEVLAERYGGEVIPDIIENSLMLLVIGGMGNKSEIDNLISKGYFNNRFITNDGYYLSLTAKCRNYFEMEKEYERSAPVAMFRELSNKEEDIVRAIHDKPNHEALGFLCEAQGGELKAYDITTDGSSKAIIGEFTDDIYAYLDGLKRDGFIDMTRNVSGGIIACTFRVLPKCKDYFEIKEKHMKNQKPSIVVDARGNQGNINVAGGDTINVSQAINTGADMQTMIEHISAIKRIITESGIDDDTKEDISDNLDSMQRELEAQSPNWSLIGRTKRRLRGLLDTIKDVTTVTTLMVHYNALEPLIAGAMQAFGG